MSLKTRGNTECPQTIHEWARFQDTVDYSDQKWKGSHLSLNMCFKDPPRDAQSANSGDLRGVWGRGAPRLSSCQILCTPLTTTRWLSVRISYWQEGVRSKQRRATEQERERASQRASERVSENRVGDSSKGGKRQLHPGGLRCASSSGGDRVGARRARVG